MNQPQKHVITVMEKGKPFREKFHAKRGKCIVNARQELKSTLSNKKLKVSKKESNQ